MKWFFHLLTDGTIRLMARLESNGAIGDMHEDLKPGGNFHGISYDILREARGGIVVLDTKGKAVLDQESAAT